jgi:hypothetical protein
MTTETFITIFAVLLTISLGAERLIEAFKPLFDKIVDSWRGSVKLIAAILIGFGLAALFRFDMLERLTITNTLPVVGYAVAGLIASTGSTTINRLLEWLKTLRSDTTVTVSKYSDESSVDTSVTVKSEGSRTPVETTIKTATDAIDAK